MNVIGHYHKTIDRTFFILEKPVKRIYDDLFIAIFFKKAIPVINGSS